MKTMKKLLSLSLFAGLMFGVASCEPDVPEETNGTNDIKITLSAMEATVPGGGGEASVIYSVVNPQEGAELSITTEADWVTIDTSKARQAVFECKYNDEGAARSAEIIFAYPGAEDAIFTINQEVYEMPITLEINEVQDTKVYFSVTTLDDDYTWVGQVVGKEWFDEFDSDEDIFEQDYDYYLTEAQWNGQTLEEYLTTILNKGSYQNLRYNNLDPMSEYVLYVYGLDASGERTSIMVYEEFTTGDQWEGPLEFTINAWAEEHIVYAQILPDHESVWFWGDIMPMSELNGDITKLKLKAQSNINTKIEEYLEAGYINEKSEFQSYMGYDYEVTDFNFEGFPNTEYVVYAAKWDENCVLDEVYYEVVTTGDVPMSDNQLTLTLGNITATTCSFTLETTNDDQYVVAAIPVVDPEAAMYGEARWDFSQCKTDADYFKVVYEDWAGCDSTNDWGLIYYTDYGSIVGTMSYLDPGTEHILFAFGYTAGVMTTEMIRKPFTTLPAGDPADCEFTIEVSNVKAREADVYISPSDDSVQYYFDLFPADATTEDVVGKINEILDNLYDQNEFRQFMSYCDEDVTITNLSPETSYKIGVIPVHYGYIFDSYGDMIGQGFTVPAGCEASFSEVFTTAESKLADVSIEVVYYFNGYYDGAALAALAPNIYGHWEDIVYLPLGVQITGDYSKYRYSVFNYQDGLEDPAKFSDDVLISNLESKGISYMPAYFDAYWDTPMFWCAVAVDKVGNYSKVFRKVVTCTKDGVSPIEDIVGSADGNASAINWAPSLTATATLTTPEVKPVAKVDNAVDSNVKVFGGLDVKVQMNKARIEARRAEEAAIKSHIAERRAALAEQKAAKSATTKRYTMEKEW